MSKKNTNVPKESADPTPGSAKMSDNDRRHDVVSASRAPNRQEQEGPDTVVIHNKRYRRLPHEEAPGVYGWCKVCRARIGDLHRWGCRQDICPVCDERNLANCLRKIERRAPFENVLHQQGYTFTETPREYLSTICDLARFTAPNGLAVDLLADDDGIHLLGMWDIPSLTATDDRFVMLDRINSDSIVTRFYTHAVNGRVEADALFPGPFHKVAFSAFLQTWERDVQSLLEIKVTRTMHQLPEGQGSITIK